MASKFHGFFEELFIAANAGAVSPEFKFAGGHVEIIAEGSVFGGVGVSFEIKSPAGNFVPASALFIKQVGTVTGFACPGTFRATLGVGASNISAWVVGIPT